MFEKNPSDLIEYHTSHGPNYNFAAFSKGTTGECMCTCESKRVSRLGVGVCLYVFFKGVWINRANSDLDSLCPRQDQTLAPWSTTYLQLFMYRLDMLENTINQNYKLKSKD